MIFSRTDPSHANMAPASDKDTIESLRRQVQELKNEVFVNNLICSPKEVPLCLHLFTVKLLNIGDWPFVPYIEIVLFSEVFS